VNDSANKPHDLTSLDALTGGAFTAPTSGERAARLRDWLRLLSREERQRAVDDLRISEAHIGEFVCRMGRPVTYWFGVVDGLLKMSTDNAENIRILFLFSAVWMAVFTIPLMLFVPEVAAKSSAKKETIIGSYRSLFKQIGELRRKSPDALKFLIASAVYRDGLAGVFTFGAILGSVAFGFSKTGVILFGIAANIVAGIGAAAGGILDDRIGTKRTIVASLSGLLVAGVSVFAFAGAGQITYWVGGLALCLFVGPAQASSRTFVARFTPDGREGEIFGLYQTTGRAASFLSPTLWSLSLTLAAAAGFAKTAIFGILGIMVVLGVGLIMLLRVHPAPVVHQED